MNTAYIGLGSNLGDSFQILREAWESLGRIAGVQLGALSSPYRSEPVGMFTENWFINAAGEIRTTLSPAELLSALHGVEKKFGRKRESRQNSYQDRTLDLDLLLYDQVVQTHNNLHIPHPHLQDRLFVLLPLKEIAPDAVHPLLGRSVQGLLTELQAGENGPAVKIAEWDKKSAR